MTGVAFGGTATIEDLSFRGTGIFDPADPGGAMGNVTNATVAGVPFGPARLAANPLDFVLDFNNLDVDEDGTANDTVTFTLRASTSEGNSPAAFNQGVDTAFGQLDNLLFEVLNVSGTATDSGDNIVFDGFTGAIFAAGGGAAVNIDVSAEVNGELSSIISPATGAFQFQQNFLTFSEPTPTVLFDNGLQMSTGGGASLVARAFDLQFSTEVDVPMLPGDANGDGTVDLADFGILRANFGSTMGTFATGDFNGDMNVDLADFGILRANFGTSSGSDLAALDAWYASVVPEPTTLGLCGIAGLAMLRRRR
ncbi:MAG: PEP-CTERM sorting domain-containing protein [Planctomycetota bacterium]